MDLTRLVDPAQLTGFVRTLAVEENRNKFALSTFLPVDDQNVTEFKITRQNTLDVDVAMYRPFDTESPIGKRKGIITARGEIPPLSQKIPLGEEATLKLDALRTGDTETLIREIFNDAARTARALLARLELARGQVLETGTLVLNENGVVATIDYGRSGSHTVAAPTLWSDTAASDPIGDLTNWVNTYVTTNGVRPGFIITSSAVVQNLVKNTGIRNLAFVGAGSDPTRVSRTVLNSILTDFELPPIFVYDSQVRVNGVATRIISADKVVFMPPQGEPLGATVSGVTAEAIKLAGNGVLRRDQAPGITTVIYEDEDPVTTWTKSSALALPVLANPDLTLVADVQ